MPIETPRLFTRYAYGQIISLEVSTSSFGRFQSALATTPTLATPAVFAARLTVATMLAAIPMLPARLAPLTPAPTSACAVHPVNDAGEAGRLIATTSPGAMSVGVVGPSSDPFERCTSILTASRTPSVVFSTVPLKELLGAS